MPILGFNSPNASTIEMGYTLVNIPTQISLESYQMIADCGINVICGWWNDWGTYNLHDDILLELDYAEEVGIVYIVHDGMAITAKSAEDLERFAEYMSKSAYGGTILMDEPGAVNFAELATAVNAWKESGYSDSLAYINMLPIYAAMYQLEDNQWTGGMYEGTFASYEEWVQLYLETVNPRVFSYDFYPYMNNYEYFRSDWYKNLSIVRYYTTEAGIPFWVFGQVGDWIEIGEDGSIRQLSYAETAIQFNTMLAYGAKGIEYYNYFTPPNYVNVDGSTACVTSTGEKTRYYDMVAKINAQASVAGEVLMQCAWQGVIQVGDSMAEIPIRDKVTSYGALVNASGSGDAIIGCFEYRDKGHAYYVSSNNVEEGATILLELDGIHDITVVQDGVETNYTADSALLEIPAGEGVLVVVR